MMRKMMFPGIIMTCVLALILVIGTGFISVARADKPPWAGVKIESGYAKLMDVPTFVVWSDSGSQYEDKYTGSGNGEDMVELGLDKGNLVSSRIVLGIVNDPYNSSRRVRFLFDIYNDAIGTPGAGMAVYDILHDANYGTPDGTVHFRVMHHVDDVAFIVDPGFDGTAQGAITLSAVNDFYQGDEENQDYEDSGKGHVIYYLEYPGGIVAEPVAGTTNQWTIKPSAPEGPVTLYVTKLIEKPIGNSGKVRLFPERLDLATYTSIPFELTASTESLPQAPPRSYNTVSSLWGKVKSR